MEQKKTAQSHNGDKERAFRRIAGFSLNQLWVFMMFYSIVPYFGSTHVRDSLYTTLFISLCAMVITLLFVFSVTRRNDRIVGNQPFILGAASLTCLGSILTVLADAAMFAPHGMLILGCGAILTGAGSAVLFLGWLELFSSLGERSALIELSVSSAAAFALGFVLIALPGILAALVIIALPPVSGRLLCRESRGRPAAGADGGAVVGADGGAVVGADVGAGAATAVGARADVGAGATGAPAGAPQPRQPQPQPPQPQPRQPPQPLSRQAVVLFAKALGGAFLLGALAGFFDVLSGYRSYVVQDIHGIYLFAGGFLAVLVICLTAIFRQRGDIFFAYRFSLLLLCLGCLLTPFLSDSNTYANALTFGGYNCFIITLCVVCITISKSFRIDPVKAVGIGMFGLYIGELVGYILAYAFDAAALPVLNPASITLVAVSLLFIIHLFLFTEIDLVRVGIGEVGSVTAPDEGDEGGLVPAAGGDPCALIIERYGLSPRESDVLPLLVQGRTISRIQETLFISAGTVSTHIRHIYQKTGANNRQELIDLLQNPKDSP
jgi:DNA-binding CsgD family transcriptional regulator